MVQVRKRLMSTPELCRVLARSSDCAQRDIGAAGRKDTRAITSQWLSLPVEPVPPDDDRVEILSVQRHNHKLRRGHLRANRFQIRIAGIREDAETLLPPLMARIASGIPNYYGVQRFGRDGLGADRSVDALRVRRRNRRNDHRFAASIVQAALFNRWLGQRIQDDALHRVFLGDILKKRETGGLFTSDDVETDQARMDALELDVTGPIYGPKMRSAEDIAGVREEEIRRGAPLEESDWSILARLGKGSRRVARIAPDDLSFTIDDGCLHLNFTLPSGSYATVLIKELTH